MFGTNEFWILPCLFTNTCWMHSVCVCMWKRQRQRDRKIRGERGGGYSEALRVYLSHHSGSIFKNHPRRAKVRTNQQASYSLLCETESLYVSISPGSGGARRRMFPHTKVEELLLRIIKFLSFQEHTKHINYIPFFSFGISNLFMNINPVIPWWLFNILFDNIKFPYH